MVTSTKAQILPPNSTKVPTAAAIDNEVMFVAEAAKSGEPAFARAMDGALSREGARFNFVFDYPKNEHARSLYSGRTFNHGNWFLQPAWTIAEADGTR